jgi:putative PIN family toxin of toxin-antitoxin system
LRVVLDTNCLVSALLFGGRLAWLRAAWQAGRIVPLFSRATTLELLRVLGYAKFALTAEEREDLLADILPFAETIAVPEPPPRTPAPRDPWDRPFLELALAARADALVSGDADLRRLAGRFAVAILSPAELHARLERGRRAARKE